MICWHEAVFTEAEMPDYEEIAKTIRSAPDTGEPYADWPGTYGDWRTHEMSDHLPVWIELEVDYSNAYLADIAHTPIG